mmetsp:Transcript_19018/g.31703  ORF Transcript_19018/g.31703 Transcript_19018/m.31703 type:complete len:485 (-) Transcript_19018:4958-6412(-)|eukprot:CAMPEP_0203791136 /NCGR_PEP_ID=MMETSP0100_2-20121128/4455_1 /ASSEMBLY_ACC=CAM_ASM_000210 /TAXON_ID=96639 /ORGANISM=" , Strain NY0313808BC1" /LENGTH=484 /DNA_ID=CAMNT_0050694397 /DNA_START=224 /DNA_END=1678 /DNA_ORIENTATION=+
MLRFFSDRLLEITDTVEEIANSTLSPTAMKGIARISEDKRLVITGYLGDTNEIKLPDGKRSLPPVSTDALLEWHKNVHGDKAEYMVWNLSGRSYDYVPLKDQVVQYDLGVHPAPAFKLLRQLVDDIIVWLSEGDGKHVAYLHDISGRRSAVVAACIYYVLLLRGPHVRASTKTLLDTLSLSMGAPGRHLVPSQVRYIDYFRKSHEKEVDTNTSVELQRIIVNGIPDFINDESSNRQLPIKCCPFLKIFQQSDGVVAGTLPGSWYTQDDSSFALVPESPFPTVAQDKPLSPTNHVGVILKGDVLFRVYHQCNVTNRSIPMFAAAFHTSFIPEDGILRFRIDDLDGAKGNGRFPLSFFVDLVFGPKTEGRKFSDSVDHKESAIKFKKYVSVRNFLLSDDEEDEEDIVSDNKLRTKTHDGSSHASENSSISDELDQDLLGENLTKELERYASDIKSLSSTTSADLADVAEDSEEDFDIDAFASSLNL